MFQRNHVQSPCRKRISSAFRPPWPLPDQIRKRSGASDTVWAVWHKIQPDSTRFKGNLWCTMTMMIYDDLWWSMTYRFLLKIVKAEKTIEPGSATFPSSQQSHPPPGIILWQPHRHCTGTAPALHWHCTGTAPAGCMCHWAHTCPPGFPWMYPRPLRPAWTKAVLRLECYTSIWKSKQHSTQQYTAYIDYVMLFRC